MVTPLTRTRRHQLLTAVNRLNFKLFSSSELRGPSLSNDGSSFGRSCLGSGMAIPGSAELVCFDITIGDILSAVIDVADIGDILASVNDVAEMGELQLSGNDVAEMGDMVA